MLKDFFVSNFPIVVGVDMLGCTLISIPHCAHLKDGLQILRLFISQLTLTDRQGQGVETTEKPYRHFWLRLCPLTLNTPFRSFCDLVNDHDHRGSA